MIAKCWRNPWWNSPSLYLFVVTFTHTSHTLPAPPPQQVLNTEASSEALLPYIKVFQSLIR